MMTIDEEDFDKIKHLNLTLNHSIPTTFYAKADIYVKRKYIKKLNIHRVIMGLGDFKDDKRIVHHKDNNGLNNCKDNLEICTNMYNCQSFRRSTKNNYKHYYFENYTKKWRVEFQINGKKTRKRFTTEKECVEFIAKNRKYNGIVLQRDEGEAGTKASKSEEMVC